MIAGLAAATAVKTASTAVASMVVMISVNSNSSTCHYNDVNSHRPDGKALVTVLVSNSSCVPEEALVVACMNNTIFRGSAYS